MRLSSHQNILACFTSFTQDTNLLLVTQLMDKGSSLQCIQSARLKLQQQQKILRDGTIATFEEHTTYILYETIMGLKYIHENGQIHRDVKAGNILLDSEANGMCQTFFTNFFKKVFFPWHKFVCFFSHHWPHKSRTLLPSVLQTYWMTKTLISENCWFWSIRLVGRRRTTPRKYENFCWNTLLDGMEFFIQFCYKKFWFVYIHIIFFFFSFIFFF